MDEELVERISEEVHKAWELEKRSQGFHSPLSCRSSNHISFSIASWQEQERFLDHNDPKFYKWCDKCHTDLYPYEELAENIKEYDRVTVRTVLSALDKIKKESD